MSHDHDCGGGCCGHGAESTSDLGVAYSLYSKIDLDKMECLNERIEGSGRTIFRSWDRRLNFEQFVESDCDAELLINIPFTGNVKLKSLIVLGGNEDSHPSRVHLFKNRPSMNFDDTEVEADQEIELQKDADGTIEVSILFNTMSVHASFRNEKQGLPPVDPSHVSALIWS